MVQGVEGFKANLGRALVVLPRIDVLEQRGVQTRLPGRAHPIERSGGVTQLPVSRTGKGLRIEVGDIARAFPGPARIDHGYSWDQVGPDYDHAANGRNSVGVAQRHRKRAPAKQAADSVEAPATYNVVHPAAAVQESLALTASQIPILG